MSWSEKDLANIRFGTSQLELSSASPRLILRYLRPLGGGDTRDTVAAKSHNEESREHADGVRSASTVGSCWVRPQASCSPLMSLDLHRRIGVHPWADSADELLDPFTGLIDTRAI